MVMKSLSATSRSVGCSASVGAPRFTLAGLAAVNLGMLAQNLLQVGSFWFLWVSPAVLLLYALHMRTANQTEPHPAPVPA